MALLESAFGAASRVGPYFSVVSLVPAALLTTAVSALMIARPWTGSPTWSAVGHAVTHVEALPLVAGALLTVLLALVLHPLQFAMVQLLEGYWGPSPVALWAAGARIRHHQDIAIGLSGTEASVAERAKMPADGTLPDVLARWTQSEALRARASYPEAPEDVMPTALGNVLRRYEESSGRPYGLNILGVAPQLAMVAPKEHLAHLQDQRTQLDLATRLCISSGLLTVIASVLLAPSGWWLLLTLIPYAMTMAFYRGACTVAHEYGTAMHLLMDLNREALYQRLRLPPVADLQSERERNVALGAVLGQRVAGQLHFETSPPAPVAPAWRRVIRRLVG